MFIGYLNYTKTDENQQPVYLQDILQSVKRFSATDTHQLRNQKGNLWQKENFDTTIRDEKHLYHAVQYTLNNPIKAGLITNWREWKGCWASEEYLFL